MSRISKELKKAADKASIVHIDTQSKRREVWSDFTGEYYAFNPSFADEVELDGIEKAVRESYTPKFTILDGAHYYLFDGDAIGRTDIARFHDIMQALFKRNPALLEKITIYIIHRRSPKIEFYIGTKSDGEQAPFVFRDKLFNYLQSAEFMDTVFLIRDARMVERLRNYCLGHSLQPNKIKAIRFRACNKMNSHHDRKFQQTRMQLIVRNAL